MDVSWLPRKAPRSEHAGRAPVRRVGHAHTKTGTKLVRYGRLLLVEPDPGSVVYCTQGWSFYSTEWHAVLDEAGKPVLNGWPWDDLCAIARAPFN